MEARATQKFIRMSPRKLRIVAALVKGMTPLEAVEKLEYVGKRAALPLSKVIRTAIANAKVMGASDTDLIIKEIQINEGPTLKRGIAVSRGQWHPIEKRMSHIRVIVATKPEDKVKPGKKVQTEKTKVEDVKEVKKTAKPKVMKEKLAKKETK